MSKKGAAIVFFLMLGASLSCLMMSMWEGKPAGLCVTERMKP